MTSEKQQTGKGKKGGNVIYIAGAIVILALVVVVIMLLLTRNNDDSNDVVNNTSKRDVLVTSDNAEQVVQELQQEEPVRSGYFEAKMNSTWYFDDGASPSTNAYVENVTNNTRDIFFDVALVDTNEIVYSSPVIPLGGQLSGITLNKDLDAGSYDCILTYHLIDEEQNTLSTVNVSVTIEVAN